MVLRENKWNLIEKVTHLVERMNRSVSFSVLYCFNLQLLLPHSTATEFQSLCVPSPTDERT